MTISPVGDIVNDVLQAAEPLAAEAARARLAAGASAVKGQSFTVGDIPTASLTPAPRLEAAGDKKPFQRFEAMVLQNFIDTMLPSNADSAYGGGMAGDMWRGLLAEKLAGAMAQRGGIGIADRLLGDHYRQGDAEVPLGAAAPTPAQAEAGRTMLPAALLDELQRKTFGIQPADATDKS